MRTYTAKGAVPAKGMRIFPRAVVDALAAVYSRATWGLQPWRDVCPLHKPARPGTPAGWGMGFAFGLVVPLRVRRKNGPQPGFRGAFAHGKLDPVETARLQTGTRKVRNPAQRIGGVRVRNPAARAKPARRKVPA